MPGGSVWPAGLPNQRSATCTPPGLFGIERAGRQVDLQTEVIARNGRAFRRLTAAGRVLRTDAAFQNSGVFSA